MRDDGSCDCACVCLDGTEGTIGANGECDCPCTCKNCSESQIGPDGCKCPDDMCPVCEDGSDPEWSDCQCQCPPTQCGYPPACVVGRKGDNCHLASCPNCQGCSGNGVCTTSVDSCSSSCECSGPWAGDCCERIDRGGWGDPHLETLDGVSFDYFGIGQYWDCKSVANDFGSQVRFFYYGQTSFTGAVAVKAGESVVTVTTPHRASSTSKPNLRIDGTLHSITRNEKLKLEKDTIIIDIQVQMHTENESEPSVALIALEFLSGFSLTIDVIYSAKMNRQFLNLLLNVNKDFKFNTSGLCGYLDNDPSNDLVGPDGQLYNDTESFAKSWQIHKTTRPGAGVKGSWSWTESNFHPDDTVDISYNNPLFTPSYSISGFTPDEIHAATDTCMSLDLAGSILDGCIYDLVITGDHTLVAQEGLQNCPRQCSGKGRCVASQCQCVDGWSGHDCSMGACGACYFGQCEAGFCQCEVGWEGPECHDAANCTSLNNCSGPQKGVCDKTDKCLCADGYTGPDCSLVATCSNVANCSEHGVCVDFDVCKCDIGWNGTECDQVSCEALNSCSHNGICIAYDVCVCSWGWKGSACGEPDCGGISDCSRRGACVDPNTCQCYSGHEGQDCSRLIQCPQLQNCHDNGLCVVNGTNVSCRCHLGFGGSTCNETSCAGVSHCSGHGLCTEPDVCQCDVGWQGPDCAQLSCELLNYCTGHGICSAFDQCTCDSGWFAEDCSVPDCSAVSDCSSQGFCVFPNKCECFDGYQGPTCNETMSENVHTPVFGTSVYSSEFSERSTVPQQLLIVEATDLDEGKNGEIWYSIDPSGIPFNINSHVIIDSESGAITMVKAITRGLVSDGSISITLVATDRGVPSKSGFATLSLTILGANNHCPVISYPVPGKPVFVKVPVQINTTILQVLASDADFGENGRVTYALGNEPTARRYEIDPDMGFIRNTVLLEVGEFKFTVICSDNALTPCSSYILVEIKATPFDVIVETTTVPSTTTSTVASTDASTMTSTVASTDASTMIPTSTPRPTVSLPITYSTSASTTEEPASTSETIASSSKAPQTSSPEDSGSAVMVGAVLGSVLLVSVMINIVLAQRILKRGKVHPVDGNSFPMK